MQTFHFDNFGSVPIPQRAALSAGLTTVSFDGVALTCTSSVPPILLKDGNISNPCFPLDYGTLPVILIAAQFEPRVGRARDDDWSRNSYSLSGSYYEVYCDQPPSYSNLPAAPSLECGWPCFVLFWESAANLIAFIVYFVAAFVTIICCGEEHFRNSIYLPRSQEDCLCCGIAATAFGAGLVFSLQN